MIAETQQLKIVNPSDQEDWDERLVRSGKDYSFFHSSAWAEVLRASYGYLPRYFTADAGSEFAVLIPMMEVKSLLTKNRGVSLPFSDYCDALLDGHTDWKALLASIAEYGRKAGWSYIEFRGQAGMADETAIASFYSHRLDLEIGPDRLYAAVNGAGRRNIRKAMKEGVTVDIYRSPEAVRIFYGMNCRTRKEHGLPSQPFRFFRWFHRLLIDRNKGFVMLASIARQPVAGAVFLHIGDRFLFKYGASEKKWQHVRANNLLMWEAIRWAAESGYRTFCFGRTEIDNEGLRRFKSGWGAREGLIRYYRYDIGGGAFIQTPLSHMALQKRMMRRLPVPLLNLVGRLSYRHMG